MKIDQLTEEYRLSIRDSLCTPIDGFEAGYRAKEAEIQKAIESLEKSKGFGFNSTARLFTDQRQQMENASRVERVIKILKQLI